MITEWLTVPLAEVATQWGHRMDRRGRMSPCPACGHAGRSVSVRTATEGHQRWHCHSCTQSGDAVDLVAHHLLSERYTGQPEVTRWWRERQPGRVETSDWVIRQPEYPPAASVSDLLSRCRAVAHDLGVSQWMESRGLDPDHDAYQGAIGGLPIGAPVPLWAMYRSMRWQALGYRAIIPMCDPGGHILSVRARCVERAGAPKAVPPTGYSASGLMMASRAGRSALRRGLAGRSVVLVEGEPAWLAWLASPWAGDVCLGIVAGSWRGWDVLDQAASVLVVTDHDDAGDRYAEAISHGRPQAVRWGGAKDTPGGYHE